MMRSSPENIAIGRKIERIRRVKGMSQETLASVLGMSRQAISKLEQSDTVEEAKLEMVANALGITTEDIKNFSEEAIFNNFVHDNGTVFNHVSNYHINPIEKIEQLYEALLKSEREKIEILQKMLDKK